MKPEMPPEERINPFSLPTVPATSRWEGQNLIWTVGGKDVSDSELRSWCQQHLAHPYCYLDAVIRQFHINAWAASHTQ